MTESRNRTPFGERLAQARAHAKLTQAQLSKAAGIAQGTLGELEWIGDGSSAVVRLAAACGVRPEWLAEGDGDMLDPKAWPFTLVDQDEILSLGEKELGIVEGAMLNALDRIRSPNAEDLARFAGAHFKSKPKPPKKRAA